ncbi:MAG: helix-turn-helix transcriptional regulator [Alphaproteobacteria bacterium]|nr:helix-turn-helix transcriptional regulator [Alphaproteobacteria bacterium]MBU0859242.1 helix-turn-helix transcriptional regulator [Alphaproteobacteria bacterium]
MYTHSDIWRAIDRLATSFGYSASGLAKKAGLDPTTFNKSKRISADGKPRWPSTESIAKILQVTGATMSDFFGMIDQNAAATPSPNKDQIPVIGFAQAGRAGFFDEDGYPAGDGWDHIHAPATSHHTYALKVSGESMAPLYRDGDIIIVEPGTTARKGDRVVVKTKGGEVMAKELVRHSASRIELKSLNPEHDDRSFALEDVAWLARIAWVSQ